MGNRSEDMKHQLAGGRSRVDAFLEAEQVDVVRLEVLDRFEQFFERAPEAGDAEAVTGAGMVDEFAQPGTLELSPGDHVDEDANGAGLVQAVFLGGDVLIRGGHTGIAEDVSLAGRPGRLFNVRLLCGRGLCGVEGDNRSSGAWRAPGVILNRVSPSQIICVHSQIM